MNMMVTTVGVTPAGSGTLSSTREGGIIKRSEKKKRKKIPLRKSELKESTPSVKEVSGIKTSVANSEVIRTLPQLYAESGAKVAAFAKKSSRVSGLFIICQMILYHMNSAYNTDIPRCFGEEMRDYQYSERDDSEEEEEEEEKDAADGDATINEEDAFEQWILNQ